LRAGLFCLIFAALPPKRMSRKFFAVRRELRGSADFPPGNYP
jgi:hypothetical protein